MTTTQTTVEQIAQQFAEERSRQILAEGYSYAHDANHTNGEIAEAAAAYALPGDTVYKAEVGEFDAHDIWPWDEEYFKKEKHDRRRQLVIAGALLIAEIERWDREETD